MHKVLKKANKKIKSFIKPYHNQEPGIRRYSTKKIFLKILQNSQESTYAGVYFLIKLQAGDLFPGNFVKFL